MKSGYTARESVQHGEPEIADSERPSVARSIRTMVDVAPGELDTDFKAIYCDYGRDSIPPQKLLRAQLLMAFYTILNERQLMEQIDYNLPFRWFVGFPIDDRVWSHSIFTKNRDRLQEGDIARRFFARVLGQAPSRLDLLSREHFSVDGAMSGAQASIKSYRAPLRGTRPIPRSGEPSRSNPPTSPVDGTEGRCFPCGSGINLLVMVCR